MKSAKSFLLFFIGLILISCNEATKEIQEIVVIGGGLMGSSTAWHLSNKNKSVLLLEKQDSIYTQGSSYGAARIARSNNRGNDIWSYLHNRSLEETKELIEFLNSNEKERTYEMEDIYTTSPVTYVGRTSIYDQLMSSLERQKVEYKIAATPKEGQELFDVLLPEEVLIQREYNEYSGTINPSILIPYLHKAIRLQKNEVRYNQTVASIKKEENHYVLSVEDNQTGESYLIKANKVVSAAGPYSGKLMSEVAPFFDTLINPQRVFLSFIKIKDDVYENLSKTQKEILKDAYPVINSSTGTRDGSFFSMIEYYINENPIIKIGGHFQRSDIENLDEIWKKKLSSEEIEWSKNGTIRYFKLLKLPVEIEDLEIVDGYSCVYSLTETEVPYVTPIPSKDGKPDPSFIALAGLSGVGAKGAMTYGLIAANLMTNSKQPQDSPYIKVADALGFDRLMEDLNN